MLIRDAEVEGARRDVRLAGARIACIAPSLAPLAGEPVLQAAGGALLPGLHDHHLHLTATAAALGSVRCGPPQVRGLDALALALRSAPGTGWIRGIGYHAMLGEIDRDWLDRHGPARPVRIQHRGGRMWVFNSLALETLGEPVAGDGRRIDADAWLRTRMAAAPPDLLPVGARLAAFGVTGLTEVTPRNDAADVARMAQAGLPQRLLVMGGASLDALPSRQRLRIGAVKLHYHDHDLPPFDALAAEIARAHAAGRPVASHCVTIAELLLTLAAIEAAGMRAGDRIEHAGLAPPEAVEWMARLGVTVVTQPHFIAERGEAYLAEVDPADRPWLYRLRGLLDAGIPLAAGSDAPFGDLDPWASMAAAVERAAIFNAGERLDPEQALALYTGWADAPGVSRHVRVGETADLCLLDRGWAAARRDLAAVRVRATLADGAIIYDSMRSTSPQARAVDAGIRRIDSAI
ncbi:MAG: hypothetical protein JWR80_8737 [Bradyrhizobium sp.]|nr:hypothetical protein [Bradyrhizobium sp.]